MKVIFDNLREFNLARDYFLSGEPFMAKVLRLDFSRDFGRPNEFNATGEMTLADPVKTTERTIANEPCPAQQMELKQRPVHWSEVVHESAYTRAIGDRLSEVIGDTFIDPDDMSPSSQWARIAGILLYHGIDLGPFVKEKNDQPPPIGSDW